MIEHQRYVGTTARGATRSSPWIVEALPCAAPRLRMFCLPHAGGSASAYLAWGRALGPAVHLCAIQLPGRETRLDEDPIDDARIVIRRIADAIAPSLDLPFVVFGHSMGGILSFELVRELRRRRLPAPRHLFVSASRCPTRPRRTPTLHRLSDAEFLAEVCGRYNGIPQAVLEMPELVELLLPALRADVKLLELHEHVAEPPLSVPFTVFHGSEDTSLHLDEVRAWGELTTAGCEVRAFPGGHFYFHDHGKEFLAALTARLQTLSR